jgi:tRNA(Ile)-lysidine synthase
MQGSIVANVGVKHEFEQRLAASWPVAEWCDSHVVLAVSGGPDSVALLRAMVALKNAGGGRGGVYAAHLNHGVRGQAADEDQRWLELLCETSKLPLEIERADVAAVAAEQGDGLEAAARTIRYDFLRRTAERLGARHVATAHTADDQVETVLHRILRGTGIDGLAGMRPVRPLSASVALVRPMLVVTRREVLGYLNSLGQDYREDPTNRDIQWTRNRLRSELLPQLRERYNLQVDAALLRLASQASEVQQVIRELAEQIAQKCVVSEVGCVKIDCGMLEGQPPIVVREVLKVAWSRASWPLQSMGFDEWQQLAALIERLDGRTLNLPGNIRAGRDDKYVVLNRLT